MSKSKTVSTEFALEGRFLGFIMKDGYKLKSLVLGTANGEIIVKLSKAARASCPTRLLPGLWIRVVGTQKQDAESGSVKWKAERILMASPGLCSALELPLVDQPTEPPTLTPSQPSVEPHPAPKQATILVCQKSDCCKRGGRAVTEALIETLRDRQLTDQVCIKATGCMKRCKAGPHVVMPDKTRYSSITAQDIPHVIAKHFKTTPSQPAPLMEAVLACGAIAGKCQGL